MKAGPFAATEPTHSSGSSPACLATRLIRMTMRLDIRFSTRSTERSNPESALMVEELIHLLSDGSCALEWHTTTRPVLSASCSMSSRVNAAVFCDGVSGVGEPALSMLAVDCPDVLVHVTFLVKSAPAGEKVIRRKLRPCPLWRHGQIAGPERPAKRVQ